GSGIGLVTVNTGSGDITIVPNVDDPGSAIEISSGGSRPVAAAVGDFNSDGLTDLVVINNGDGVLELLNGTATGFTVGGIFSSIDLEHPTDIVFDAAGNVLFVTSEGAEAAVPIFLTSFGIAVTDPSLLSNLSATLVPEGTGVLFVSGPGFSVAVSLPE